IVDARQGLHRAVDAAARLRHARNLADHRRAVEILELDVELGSAVLVLDLRISADVTLALEHFEHARPQARPGGRHLRLVARGRIADAGEHIAERIVQSHLTALPTSSTSPGPGSFPWTRARAAQCGSS